MHRNTTGPALSDLTAESASNSEVKLTLGTSAGRRGEINVGGMMGSFWWGLLIAGSCGIRLRMGRGGVDIFFVAFSYLAVRQWRMNDSGVREQFFKVWQFTQDWLKESVAGFDWTSSAVTLCSREITLSRVRLSGARSLCGQTFTKFFFFLFLRHLLTQQSSFWRPIVDIYIHRGRRPMSLLKGEAKPWRWLDKPVLL